ncbi:MAG: hypothetical protein GY755_20320 [Chloroflexi bacterium]|nr:hypothetical protein [Chloroflexota bacterium]
MTDLFDQVTDSQDVFKKLASKIPGFSGYVERQNRRAADKLMRETIADRFQEQWKRTSQLQTDMISAGMLSYIDDMERAAIQMRTFIDKIRTASYGYSGLFDAVKINEEELAKLYSFDQGFFLAAEELGRALDNVEASINDEAGLPAAIRNVATLARQSTEAFERRSEVFTSSEA